MKKNYLLFLIVIASFTAPAQIINFPDANFKAKLLAANTTNEYAKDINGNSIVIDVNGNGQIEQSEALMVYKLFDITASTPPFKLAYGLISDLTGIAAFANLRYLNISGNQLTTLDLSNNVLLTYLNCNQNQLTTLDLTANTLLISLNCNDNQLTNNSLNLSGLIHLENLGIGNNLFTTYTTDGLSALKSFSCIGNQMTSINVNNSLQLESLVCSNNQLTSLEISNLMYLKTLNCSGNLLTALNLSTSTQLLTLVCNNNLLTALDTGNAILLNRLVCSYNNIAILDFSHNPNLKSVNCNYNLINTIVFDDNPLLTEFNGDNNLLVQLDFSATGIRKLKCSNNPNLVFINIKNGFVSSDTYLEPMVPFPFYNFYLQNLPALNYICHDEGEIGAATISNNPGLENVSHGTYCSFEPGGTYNTVNGTVKFDCAGSDTSFYNQKIIITNGFQTGFTYTNTAGNYTFYTGVGNVTVMPQLENSTYFTVSPTNYTFNFTNIGNTETANFCLTPNGLHSDVEVALIPVTPARPGFDVVYKIVYKNKGNQIQSGTVSLTFDDTVLDFITATQSLSLQTENLLSWDFMNLNPFENRSIVVTLNVNAPTETPAVVNGDILHYQVVIATAQNDETPNDNLMDFSQTVVGSFDPNDKTVLQGEQLSIAHVNDYLHYIVRFQNTGTAVAENIVIKDLLDPALDWSTLEMVSSSHPYRSVLTSGNKLEVFYEGINLVSSITDEDASHGYIAFKIKPKNTTAIDDVISNTASIYFDYNFPIITNTVTTTVTALGTETFNGEQLFTFYPNPVRDELQVSVAIGTSLKTISVHNTLGQNLITVSGQAQIDLSTLSKGVYFVVIETDSASATQKIIKL
ncbi:T9SS type A sorting domain-containing protein [Flavobacterium silvisoli]|uniref:T9SS type A sorting domain-containing protein n=1 Tax=Flavobacterium silvisoli TaxID=2529433 RepID=A0A4V2L5E2_9FLAO|nr:T9SS type A sorting domain-containing protein [Flavobacterium silvisoli]TBX70163.1 T9SS type A sorting domain-containing protein [Flavobacterium silvisoli]